jgi:hypothetical protein
VSALVLKHLESIGASMALLNAQLEALKHELAPRPAPPVARESAPERPARCAGVPDARCGLRDDEACLPRGSFGNPNAWQCVGCKYEGASR